MKFIKSSFSDGNSNCPEMTRDGDTITMRDSDRPDEIITSTVENMQLFILGVKNGDFDQMLAD